MSSSLPSRDSAWELLTRYNHNSGMIAHALAVESVMRHFAEKFGKDPDQWGIIGLVHDLDYEQYQDQHCRKTEEILRAEGWPEEYIRAGGGSRTCAPLQKHPGHESQVGQKEVEGQAVCRRGEPGDYRTGLPVARHGPLRRDNRNH